jgi:hypothetical protein
MNNPPWEAMGKGKGECIGMRHAVTSPTYLLHGLIAKNELKELLDLLYDSGTPALIKRSR